MLSVDSLPALELWASTALVALFGGWLGCILFANRGMFTKRHGRTHTTLGLLYLLWITMGFIDVLTGAGMVDALLFHALLGSLGICLTLAAAHEFQHKNVKNVASGVLDEHATVTYGEMIEHSFYQGVNLMQILFLHSVRRGHNASLNLLLVFVATSPWLFRDMFPVNRFSDNYTKEDTKSSSLVRFLYRVKKYQYVFYKHFVLHGLNVTVAVYGYQLVQEKPFRLFWLFLNVSYVMDFFLQTLVKKKYLPQQSMLVLQQILMLASSIAAVSVLKRVNMIVALASLVLNFVNRKHDVLNTMVLAVCSILALR